MSYVVVIHSDEPLATIGPFETEEIADAQGKRAVEETEEFFSKANLRYGEVLFEVFQLGATVEDNMSEDLARWWAAGYR